MDNSKTDSLISTALTVANNINNTTPTTLAESSKASVISSVAIIDSSLQTSVDENVMRDILQTALTIYTSYYLNSVTQYTKVNGVYVHDILDRFSNDRSLQAAISNIKLDAFDYIMDHDPNSLSLPDFAKLDSFKSKAGPADTPVVKENEYKPNQANNLAIGKRLTVELGTGNNKVSVNVTAYIKPSYVSSEAIQSTAKLGSSNDTVSARYKAAMAGQISWIRDFVFCLDLVENDKNALIEIAKTGSGAEFLSKRRLKLARNSLLGLISGKRSVNSISTISVISKSTARVIESTIGGSLSKYKHRSVYFDRNLLSTLYVVDPVSSSFDVYQRGFDESATFTFNEIKNVPLKDSQSDIMKLMLGYQKGNFAYS